MELLVPVCLPDWEPVCRSLVQHLLQSSHTVLQHHIADDEESQGNDTKRTVA